MKASIIHDRVTDVIDFPGFSMEESLYRTFR